MRWCDTFRFLSRANMCVCSRVSPFSFYGGPEVASRTLHWSWVPSDFFPSELGPLLSSFAFCLRYQLFFRQMHLEDTVDLRLPQVTTDL